MVSVLLVGMEQLQEAGAVREDAIGNCPTSFLAEVCEAVMRGMT